MEYREIKGTRTSLLGMGCMRLPRIEGQSEAIDFQRAEELIDRAYAGGINYYDTAYIYHGGESEVFIGKALAKYPRDSYMVATKLPGYFCKNLDDVKHYFSTQLERTGLDYFDFYLCHGVDERSVDNYSAGYIIPELVRLKDEGKIRKLGFSSHGTPETLMRFAKLYDWDFAQIQLNYLDWDYQDAKRQYEILSELGIPIVVMEPVRGGRLASITDTADKLFKAHSPDASIASWALRWVASLPNVRVILSGMSNIEQLEDNVKTLSAVTPITDAEQKVLDEAVRQLRESSIVPCTGCRYCVDDCPSGLDIPKLMEIRNDYALTQNLFSLIELRDIPQDKKPASCVACGACVARCPQNLDIPGCMSYLSEAEKKVPPPPKRKD